MVGLLPGELHVTLAYLGAGLTDEQVGDAQIVISALARQHSELAGSLGGLGQFPAGDEGRPYYVPVDLPGLTELRTEMVRQLEAVGVPVAGDHGFTPHMTLSYVADGEPPPEPVDHTDVTFSALTLKVGPSGTDYPLTTQSD